MVGLNIMGRRRSQGIAEDIGQLVVALVVLGALSGGIVGFSERLRGLLGLLISAIVVVGVIVAVVCLFRWWLRSSANPANPPPGYTETTCPPLGATEPFVHEPEPMDWSSRLRSMDWYQFEKLVGFLHEKEGLRVERRGGANPDGGVDLVVLRGTERTAIQCKQWRSQQVGVKPVREFFGAMRDLSIPAGLIVTLNGFSSDAMDFARRNGIGLWEEDDLLARLNGLDASAAETLRFVVDNTEKRCPKCDARMVLRTAKKGPNPGQHFWGCSCYPRCRFTLVAA